ncbi:MAG TPA: hypothetical protein VKE40_26185 [Gemmataceae bacterium]|nr:hypothetical protein [Gemmataceae bacterium]
MMGPAFPRLTPANHRVTSPATTDYNCIAWAAGDTAHWWEPGRFWPLSVGRDEFGVGALETAFRHLGFEPCESEAPEPGFEKVALYAESALHYTHAARQLATGLWTSKLGGAEDIEHDSPDDVAGGVYGEVVQFMKRPIRSPAT